MTDLRAVRRRRGMQDGPRDRAGRVTDMRRQGLTFAAAVFSLVVSFVAVGATVPLFNIYRAEDGLTNADISLTVVAYSAATLVTLLMLGRMSSFVGRRRVSILGLILLLAGSLMFIEIHSAVVLVTARVALGVGVGLVSSATSSYVIDSAPTHPGWLAGFASSQSVMVGLAVGGVGAGALVQFGPWRRSLVFAIVCVLLVVAIAMIAFSRETVAARPGVWRSMRPHVHLPVSVRHLIPVAVAALLPTWAIGAYYQAFVPAIIEEQLHTVSALTVGVVFALYMGPSAIGAVSSGRLRPATGQRVGMTMFLLGLAGVVVAISTGALWLFVIVTVVAGAAQGIVISATTRGLLQDRTVDERAPIFSVIYLISYLSATVPALIAGQLSQLLSLRQITYGYAGLVLVAAVFTLTAARSPEGARLPVSSR